MQSLGWSLMNRIGHLQRLSARQPHLGQHIRSIGSRLICLALGTLLSTDSARGGFDDVWWSESGPGWTNASDRPVVSNLVVREWTEVWTQNSNVSTIPAIDWSRYLISQNALQRDTAEGANTDIMHPNRGIFGWNNNLFLLNATAHYGPIGAYTNGPSRTFTNVYSEYPRPDLSATITNYYDQPDLSLNVSGGGYATNVTWIWTNSAGTRVTNNIVTSCKAATVDLYGNTIDAVTMDVYYALAERWAVLQGDHDEDRTGIDDDYKPVLGRRGQTRNLDRAKDFLSDALTSFVDPFGTNDFTELFGTNYASILDWDSFALTESNLIANTIVGPTNYFDYTPPQLYALHPVVDYGRIVTNSWTMVCSGTNACTNSVIDFEGDTREVVGTNGQAVTFLSTNENVQAGYTLSDYGWKHMPTLITNGLRWIGGTYSQTPTYLDAWSLTNGATWADAKANATNAAPLTKAGNWTTGIIEDQTPDLYIARWYSSSHAVTAASATNIEAEVDLYVYADIDGATPFTLGSNVWDDALFPALIESRMALVTNLTTTNSVAGVTFSTTNRGAWCAEPVGYNETNRTWRGYFMNYGKKRALYRYDDYLDNE